MEYVDEDGEVHVDLSPEAKAAFAEAKRDLASFKFKLLETVAADRRLRKAPCAQVMIVYCRFLTIDPRTMKPKPVYASCTKVMAHGGILTKKTVIRARKLLIQHDYLKATGSQTKDGCIWFTIQNPNYEQVSMSIKEAEEHYARLDAEEKQVARSKKQKQNIGSGVVGIPPETTEGCHSYPDSGVVGIPNYLGGNRGRFSSEGSNQQTPVDVAYGQIPDIDPNEPFPIPETDEELASAIADFVMIGCSPVVVNYFRQELLAGRLTMNMVEEQRRLRAA